MLLDDITSFVEANINHLSIGDNLFKNYYPDSPDTLVSIIDSGGFPPDRYSPVREKTFEIKIRSKRYSDGVKLGNQIFELFHSKENYNLGDFFILSSYAYSELSYLFADNENRKEFSIELSFQYQY